MDEEARKTLELFIEKAEKLTRSGFLHRILDQGAIWVSRKSGEQEWSLQVTEEEIDAFLLTFRLFIQHGNERISLGWQSRLDEDILGGSEIGLRIFAKAELQPMLFVSSFKVIPQVIPSWCIVQLESLNTQ